MRGGGAVSWLRDSLIDFWQRRDKLLLSLCLIASGYGLVLIYSATRWTGSSRGVLVQMVAIAIGVVAYVALSSVDIEFFVEKSWKLLLIFNVALILALIPFGVGENTTGNKSWIPLPGLPLNIQPAEVAKLTFILLLAWQCSKLQTKGISRPFSVFSMVGHTLMMAGLIAVMIWGYSIAPEDAPPLPVMAVFIAIPGAVLLGVMLALLQRIREIQRGEEEDAKQY